jgi:thiamine biosynthesis lipoprotein
MQQLTFRAMGGTVLVALDSDDPARAEALQQAQQWFAEWEHILSRFLPQSELSRLNAQPEQWIELSETLWDVLTVARVAAAASGGLVSPALLPALEAAGYRQSFELLSDSAIPETDVVVAAGDWKAIEFDPRRRAVYLPAGMRLDLGGVAKSWATDQIAVRLGRQAPALVDAGGDIAASAPRRDGTAWPIGVSDPAGGADLDLVLLTTGGVATSGRDYRRWQQNGVWQHHIIDPRLGRPAVTDLISVTVIAPTAGEAELHARTALIQGSGRGMAWIEARPHLAALLVLEDGQVLRSRHWAQHCWPPAKQTQLPF